MSQARSFATGYVGRLSQTLAQLPQEDIAQTLDMLQAAHARGRQLLLAGNGGSAATANHMANDLMFGVAKRGGAGFRAVSLSANVAVITALANDEGYPEVFAGQLRTLARAGDVLIVISGSGNSPNVVRAAEVARTLRLQVIGLLGMDGGAVRDLCDSAIVVPSHDYGVIEDVHMMLDHLIAAYFCQRFAQLPAGKRANDG